MNGVFRSFIRTYSLIFIVDSLFLTLLFLNESLWLAILYFILFLIINFLLFDSIKTNHIEKNRNALYYDILKYSQDINVYVVDRNFNYLLMNKSDIDFMEKYFKIIPEVGKNLALYLSKEHYLVTRGNLEEAFKGNLTSVLDHFVLNGDELFVRSYYSPLYDNNNEIYAILCYSINLTPDIKSQQESFKLVYRDPLTELYNRRKLLEYFEEIHHRENKSYWMLLLDVDNFKAINDNHGHLYGDSVLIKLATSLREIFPRSAKLFRIGGDEFCIIIEDKTSVNTEAMIKDATHAINEILQPSSISLGFIQINSSDSYTFNDYYEMADKNMYDNKKDKQLLSFIEFNQMGRFMI